MDDKELEIKYKELLEDDNFEKIVGSLKKPNIFNILKIERKEFAHSNVLAWLLNPSENHGLGIMFLERFLRELFIDERSNNLSIINIPKLNLENATVKTEWKNIDILIELNNVVIVIENKIDSTEHSNQLSKYKSVVDVDYHDKNKVFVYLTPFGDLSSLDEHYINISYVKIVDILNKLAKISKKVLNKSVLIYLKDYIKNLNISVMESQDINKAAVEIYRNNKDFFDFIIQNIPDERSVFLKKVEGKFESKNWIMGSENKNVLRFLTQNLNDIIPKGYATKELKYRESFVFLIHFPNKDNNNVRIQGMLYGTDEEATQIMKPVLDKIDKRNNSKQYLSYDVHNVPIDGELIYNKDEGVIEENVKKIIETAEIIIARIEPALCDVGVRNKLIELIEKRKTINNNV